jgi:hypothetical protein
MKEVFPKSIRVSGFPFMLQGWNNIYHQNGETQDGCPVYELNDYTLYLAIPIIGTKIYRCQGQWVFHRNCDIDCMPGYAKYGTLPQSDPFGYWSNGVHVTPL